MSMNVPKLTEQQRGLFDALGLAQFDDIALVSTVEKATGKHRALVAYVGQEGGSVFINPIAMLLDGDDDIDLFERPSTDVFVAESEK